MIVKTSLERPPGYLDTSTASNRQDVIQCHVSPPCHRGAAQTSECATPGFKHRATGSPLDPSFSALALVNVIIAAGVVVWAPC